MSKTFWVAIAACTLGAALAASSSAWAQEETPTAPAWDAQSDAEKIATLKAKDDADTALISDAALAGHNAWMLTSTALVLFMTAPGLAMFYSGLVRKKNVLSVMMQCIFLMGMMTVIWALYGYSLAFGGTSPYIGNGEYLLMNGVQRYYDTETNSVVTPMFNAGLPWQIPMLTHMLFQGMFFIITPALICGAFAERMKFSTMVVFSILWGTLVYCPLCHWVWDGGILAYVKQGATGNGIAGGALDFAGGTVVHISSGVSALICALLIGRRLGFGTEDMRPHNLTYTVLGAAMLWFGWFGFNAGSELASDGLTSSAFCVTHFAAAGGAISWAVVEWITRKHASVLGAASGLVAGLVCITPAAGFVQPIPAIGMGMLAGVICYFACSRVKATFGYDDSLDAFGVHGVGGTLGAVLTGVFATVQVCDTALVSDGKAVGLVDGRVQLLIGQLVAIGITWVVAIVATFIILKVLDVTMGLRVSQEKEIRGLDVSEHGEEGYIFN